MRVDNVACVAGHRHQKTVPVASNTDTKKQQQHHRHPRPRRRHRHHFSDVTGNQVKFATAMSEAEPVRDGDAQWAQMMALRHNTRARVITKRASLPMSQPRAPPGKSGGQGEKFSGGVGGGVAALFRWELMEMAANWGGEGRRGVDGVSGGNATGIVSGAKGEG